MVSINNIVYQFRDKLRDKRVFRSINRLNKQYDRTFTFLGIIFGIYLLLLKNKDPYASHENYIWGVRFLLLVLFAALVSWVVTVKIKKQEFNKFWQKFTTLLPFMCWFMPFFYIIYVFNQERDLLDLAQIIAPTALLILYYHLMKDKQIETDSLIKIKRKIEQYAQLKKVIHLVPSLQNRKTRIAKPEAVKFVYDFSTNTSNIRILRNKSEKDPIHLENVTFLFYDSNSKVYRVPNKTNFQFLDDERGLESPNGLSLLQSNSLGYLFQMQLFDSENGDIQLNKYDINRFLNYGESCRIVVESAVNDTQNFKTVEHSWNVRQIQSAASITLQSLTSSSSDPKLKLLKEIFEQNISGSLDKRPYLTDMILCYITILSKYSPNDPGFLQPRWTGLLTGFAHMCQILIEELDHDTSSKIDNLEMSQICNEWDRHVQLINRDPVAEFIKKHDSLIQNGKDEYPWLDQTIATMMEELEKTMFKQRLVMQQKYDSQQLVEIRSGIVAGITIGLELIRRRTGD
jgi:hypothetical protein